MKRPSLLLAEGIAMDQENWWQFLAAAIALLFLWRYLLIISIVVAAFAGIGYALFLHQGAIEWRIAVSVGIFIAARYLISIIDNDVGTKKNSTSNRSPHEEKRRALCAHCNGVGRMACNHPGFEVGRTGICNACYGTGIKTCPYCNGNGHYG
jgi:hypothetical protein